MPFWKNINKNVRPKILHGIQIQTPNPIIWGSDILDQKTNKLTYPAFMYHYVIDQKLF